jgi:hypothetical protein
MLFSYTTPILPINLHINPDPITIRMSSVAIKTFCFMTSAQVVRLYQAAIAKAAKPSQVNPPY